MLKWPLVIAAIVIVARIITEQTGAPASVNNLLSANVLCVLIFPLYFAFRIAGSGSAHPYKALLKTVALYALLVRVMIIPTYWLAYILQWQAPRFAADQGGVVGPDVTLPVVLLVPLALTAFWTLASVVIGGALGSLVIALRRRAVAA
jgi:hypothetical protein